MHFDVHLVLKAYVLRKEACMCLGAEAGAAGAVVEVVGLGGALGPPCAPGYRVRVRVIGSRFGLCSKG